MRIDRCRSDQGSNHNSDLDSLLNGRGSDDDSLSPSVDRSIFHTPATAPRGGSQRRFSIESTATTPSMSDSPKLRPKESTVSQKEEEEEGGWDDAGISIRVPVIDVGPSLREKALGPPSVRPEPIKRIAELAVRRMDCVQSEAMVRFLLTSISGVTNVDIDPITSVVIIEYDPKRTSAWTMMSTLRSAYCSPLSCSLHSIPYDSTVESQLSQLTVALPPEYQRRYGRSIIQNHVLARAGLKSCVFSTNGHEMYINYDTSIVGARQIVEYINQAGVECHVIDESQDRFHKSVHGGITFTPNGGISIVMLVALMLLWMDWSPPPIFQSCIFNGVSVTLLIHFILCSFMLTWIGTPYVLAGYFAAKRKLFTSYIALSFSALGIFFISSMGLVVSWILGSPILDHSTQCTGIGTILCFDQVCWTLIAWCLGQNVTRWIKTRLSVPLQTLEKSLHPRGYVRVVGEGGKLNLIPRALGQNGDIVVVRPGETLWCDGIAQTEVVVKEPLVVSSMANCRPFTKTPNDSVYAGTLVMSGELKLKATKVGDTKLQQSLVTAKMLALRNSISNKGDESFARAYGLIAASAGVVIGLYKFIVFEAFEISYAEEANIISGLLQSICFASAIWLGSMSLALHSGIAAVASCSAGLLTTLGGIPTSIQSLPRASNTKQIVITRSALSGPSASSITSVVVCPAICRSVVESLRLPSRDARKYQWKLMKSTETSVEESEEVDERSVTLLWSLVGYLENGGTHGDTRIGRLLRKEANQHGAACGVPASVVRVFPGKGIEGDAPMEYGSINSKESPKGRRSVVAVGSLDFILACHQFGMGKVGVSHAAKSEWRALHCWIERILNDGYDVMVVAYNGLPLGAITIYTDYGVFLKPAFNFISECLACSTWIVTSANLLSSKALSINTGIPLDRIISGASPSEKIRLIEDLINREGKSLTFVSSMPSLVEAIARQRDEMRAEVTTVLMGADVSPKQPTADFLFPGSTVTGLINLLLLSRMTKNAQCVASVLAFLILPVLSIAIGFIIPVSAWRFIPLVGVSAAIISEWIILFNALLLRTMRPATVARSSANLASESPNIQQQLEMRINDLTFHRNSGELILPRKPKRVWFAMSQIGSWLCQTFERAKHMITGESDENLETILLRLHEMKQ